MLWTLNKLTDSFQYSRGGLFALINASDKKVDIRYSSNLILSIGGIITKLAGDYSLPRELILDKDKLTLIVLELCDDDQSRRLHHAYWCDYYKTMGYELYRQHPALSYNVRILIRDMFVYVSLENRNYDSLLVGIFDNMTDANSFIAHCYKEDIKYPVYAINELTKAYFKTPPTER